MALLQLHPSTTTSRHCDDDHNDHDDHDDHDHDYDHNDCNTSEHDTLLKTGSVSLRSLNHGDDFEDVELRPTSGFLCRLLMLVRRRRTGASTDSAAIHDSIKLPDDDKEPPPRRWRWQKLVKDILLWTTVVVLCFFGLVHLFNVGMLWVPVVLDDHDPYLKKFNHGDFPLPGQDPSENLTVDVHPVPCHSHNDYWRKVPLYEALHYGCTGVEADVWLFNDELYVGHTARGLTLARTFRSMYVDPIVKMLDQRNQPSVFSDASNTTKNGIFQVDPAQTLVLLVDFKSSGSDAFPFVSDQLSALREKGYLTYFDGKTTLQRPVTVVATGNAPFDLITANTTYRDIFFDAPLDRMVIDGPTNPTVTSGPLSRSTKKRQHPNPVRTSGQGTVGTSPSSQFDDSNSYYASVSFKKSIGMVLRGHLSNSEILLIRAQIDGARQRGLQARYWSTPKWPVGLRNHVWEVLVREGVGYLNGDDLEGMAMLNWRVKRHGSILG